MRTITITAWRRPTYLQEVLDSLFRNDTSGWRLYIGLEPGGPPEMKAVCESANRFIDTEVRLNPTRFGVRDNPFALLQHVFDTEGSEANVYLEEDTIVSPDTLRLATWYLDEVDKVDLMSLQLFNPRSDPSRPSDLFRFKKTAYLGTSLGIVMTRAQWERWFRSYWYDDEIASKVFPPETIGWDWAIRAALALHPQLRTLMPRTSRTNHIGREAGVHCPPEFHDRIFEGLRINQLRAVPHYRIERRDVVRRLLERVDHGMIGARRAWHWMKRSRTPGPRSRGMVRREG